jgi:HK97 gp10 family phage protein
VEFSVKVEGLAKIDKATKDVREAVAREINKALYASAKKVEAEAKRSIAEGGKTGRTYTRGGITHRASAPGEAPATDTGRLVNSITGELVKDKGGEAEVRAGGGVVNYARALEFGTTKMAARPFLFPALEKSKGWIKGRLDAAVRKAAIDSVKRK